MPTCGRNSASKAAEAVPKMAACKVCRQEKPLHAHGLCNTCYKWAYRFLHPGYNFIQANAA